MSLHFEKPVARPWRELSEFVLGAELFLDWLPPERRKLSLFKGGR